MSSFLPIPALRLLDVIDVAVSGQVRPPAGLEQSSGSNPPLDQFPRAPLGDDQDRLAAPAGQRSADRNQ